MNRSSGVTRILRRFGRSSRGGAALELAVVFPLLLLVVIGVVDYGRAFYTSVTVANAARAGAEYGATVDQVAPPTLAQMKAFAEADGLEAGVVAAASRVCECAGVTASCTTACAGGAAPAVFYQVIATKTLTTFLKYPGLPATVSISRTAIFRSQ